ncbi:cell surface glycoprotein 1-like [Eupeodes corollae]|uniref:cell surface glycoprotein 1-like n=1 Tax=Eupeodes corollae TaxID=290404 RepID=UPI002490895D|nr:cell surface glycoprotein 1-like [Eupeodes corollae]
MQKLIIVFALATCCLAAPLEKSNEPSNLKPGDLIRPSPINPDIPSDPKPEEKITLITDPKIQPSTPSNPTKLPGPYVVPISGPLLRAKREDKDSSESDEDSSEEKKKEKKSSRPLATPLAAAKLSTTPVPSTTHPSVGTTSGVGTSSTSAHPRIPYAPHIHQHNEHLFKPTTTKPHLSGSSSSSTSTSTTSTTAAPSQDHANEKRDIPVPLTRKYHHNDEDAETKPKEEPSSSASPSPISTSTAKVPKEKINQEDEGNKAEPAAVDQHQQQQHPATVALPRPVAELFAKKPSTE